MPCLASHKVCLLIACALFMHVDQSVQPQHLVCYSDPLGKPGLLPPGVGALLDALLHQSRNMQPCG